jgi:ParB family transcriptional regulator, chromosome partitioning protein
MSKEHRRGQLQMIPIDRIEVLNPRDRNKRVFDEVVGNIKAIGLKKPITVTPRPGPDGDMKFLLICGEGRLKAYQSLGEATIPAMVVDVGNEEAFIMSLVENIARRKYQPLELLAGIEQLQASGYNKKEIADKTGLSIDYIKGILTLLEEGEERLLVSVGNGRIPLNTALEIARAGNDEKHVQITVSRMPYWHQVTLPHGKDRINEERI